MFLFLDTLDTLDKCKEMIAKDCMFSMNETLMATYSECNDTAVRFFDAVDGCFNRDTDDAGCACFQEMDLDADYEKLKTCDVNKGATAGLKEKKKCKSG